MNTLKELLQEKNHSNVKTVMSAFPQDKIWIEILQQFMKERNCD